MVALLAVEHEEPLTSALIMVVVMVGGLLVSAAEVRQSSFLLPLSFSSSNSLQFNLSPL